MAMIWMDYAIDVDDGFWPVALAHFAKCDGFWIVVGFLFVIVGIWEMFELQLPLMSVLLIVIGGAFLVSALKGKK